MISMRLQFKSRRRDAADICSDNIWTLNETVEEHCVEQMPGDCINVFKIILVIQIQSVFAFRDFNFNVRLL